MIFTAVSRDGDHGYVFVQDKDGPCIACLFPDMVDDDRYPCPGTPAIADILQAVGSLAVYAVDTLLMNARTGTTADQPAMALDGASYPRRLPMFAEPDRTDDSNRHGEWRKSNALAREGRHCKGVAKTIDRDTGLYNPEVPIRDGGRLTPAQMNIDQIQIGFRYRKDLGDLRALADSIAEVGLLHPVVVTPEGRLIAGQRRLEACRLLGWTEVPVTVVDLLPGRPRRGARELRPQGSAAQRNRRAEARHRAAGAPRGPRAPGQPGGPLSSRHSGGMSEGLPRRRPRQDRPLSGRRPDDHRAGRSGGRGGRGGAGRIRLPGRADGPQRQGGRRLPAAGGIEASQGTGSRAAGTADRALSGDRGGPAVAV